MGRTSLIGFCLSAVLALASTAGAQSHYKVMDVGTIGGSSSFGNGINTPGQTAGASDTTGDAALHAFFGTPPQRLHDLGTLGGPSSSALAINDHTDIVGQADKADGTSDAFLWVDGTMKDLLTLGGSLSAATAINFKEPPEAFTQIAGWSLITGDTAFHAAIWDASEHIGDLGTLGGTNSQAFGNNCVGQVVGSSQIANDAATDAFLWDSVHGMQDLGTLGGSFAQANGINCPGVIVGFSTLLGDLQSDAFIDQGGTMKDIGNLGGSASHANAINDSGLVVGFSNTTGDADVHAFRWSSSKGMEDLNGLIPATSGWDLNSANSVSKRGESVGNGTHNGAFHAFVLIPVFP